MHIERYFAIACMFAVLPEYANCFHEPETEIYNRFEIFESKVRRDLELMSTIAKKINVAEIQGFESNLYMSRDFFFWN